MEAPWPKGRRERETDLSSREMSTPLSGGAVMFDLITGPKLRRMSFTADSPVVT
jgi:hypothetical protein